MMMKRLFIAGLLGLFVFSSCKNKGDFSSAEHENVKVDAIRTNKDDVVKVRVIFKKDEKIEDIQSFSKVMQYEMDSCFYMVKDDQKSYPIFVMPVASGIDRAFEYMIGFEKDVTRAAKLVYVDRYRSKKDIELNFK